MRNITLIFLLGFLAFVPQGALSTFQFTIDEVEQCGPLKLSFWRNKDKNSTSSVLSTRQPVALTLLPFNSTGLSIPIPNLTDDSVGVYITFVPFTQGTSFVASLDDDKGENTAFISDVIQVKPSPTSNSSCLPQTTTTTRTFNIQQEVSQCMDFTIQYDSSVVTEPPVVRAIGPRIFSIPLNMTTSNGTSTSYDMALFRGQSVLLSINDNQGHFETSDLKTVQGDSTSSKSCLNFSSFTSTPSASASANGAVQPLSQSALIGIGIAVGVVVVVMATVMGILITRRRRRQLQRGVSLADDFKPKPEPPSAQSPRIPSFEEKGFVRNPVYTAADFPTSPNSITGDRAQTRASNSSLIASQRVYQGYVPPVQESSSMPPRTRDSRQRSVSSFDIERMLDDAAYYQDQDQFASRAEARGSHSTSDKDSFHLPIGDTPVNQTHLVNVAEPFLTVPMPTYSPPSRPKPKPLNWESSTSLVASYYTDPTRDPSSKGLADVPVPVKSPNSMISGMSISEFFPSSRPPTTLSPAHHAAQPSIGVPVSVRGVSGIGASGQEERLSTMSGASLVSARAIGEGSGHRSRPSLQGLPASPRENFRPLRLQERYNGAGERNSGSSLARTSVWSDSQYGVAR